MDQAFGQFFWRPTTHLAERKMTAVNMDFIMTMVHGLKTTLSNINLPYTHITLPYTHIAALALPYTKHVAAFTLTATTFRHFYIDYQSFMALGPGGTPKNILGYCKIKALGIFALRNPYQPPSSKESKQGLLTHLPGRKGARPSVAGIAPHRQSNQKSSQEMHAKLTKAIHSMATSNPHLFEGTSCFEKHGTGLFTKNSKRKTCGGEICHAHASDGSLHLTLHPADIKSMLEGGWGERHPLARGGWFERFVPEGFVMIYAPRNDDELAVVLKIIHAATWFVEGGGMVKASDDRSSITDTSKAPVFGVRITKLTKQERNEQSKVDVAMEDSRTPEPQKVRRGDFRRRLATALKRGGGTPSKASRESR
jgi:hypothetical protein